jgi:hypothetical protein
MTEHSLHQQAIWLSEACDRPAQLAQALVATNDTSQPAVYHGGDLAHVRAHYHNIHALLFLFDDPTNGTRIDPPLRDFFVSLPPSLATGNIAAIVWRERPIAISLHHPTLRASSLFIQKMTAVMAYARTHALLRHTFLVQEEVQQHTQLAYEIPFSLLFDVGSLGSSSTNPQ